MASLPTRRVNSPSDTSIKALPVFRKNLLRIRVIERETEVTKDTVPPTNNGSTKDVQPPVVQNETLFLNSEPVVAPIIEPVAAP
nr:hypothetical protein [Tanacetum cinerariifolium]